MLLTCILSFMHFLLAFRTIVNLVAEDGHLLPQPQQLDTVAVMPGGTYDLTFYAWAAPGSVYPFHCHILTHL